jgi:hypothetical protein
VDNPARVTSPPNISDITRASNANKSLSCRVSLLLNANRIGTNCVARPRPADGIRSTAWQEDRRFSLRAVKSRANCHCADLSLTVAAVPVAHLSGATPATKRLVPSLRKSSLFCSNPFCVSVASVNLRTGPKEAFGGAFKESLHKIGGNSHIHQPTRLLFRGFPLRLAESTPTERKRVGRDRVDSCTLLAYLLSYTLMAYKSSYGVHRSTGLYATSVGLPG